MTVKLIAPLCLLLLTACSQTPIIPNASDTVSSCLLQFEMLDDVVDDESVRNAGETRIADYPFLRTNRLLASFDPTVLTAEQRKEWLQLMAELDRSARLSEFENLSAEGKATLSVEPSDFLAQIDHCRDELVAVVETQPERWTTSLSEATVPDDYVTWQRVVGLYFVTGLPLARGVTNLREEINSTFDMPEAQIPVKGTLQLISPGEEKPNLSDDELAAIVERSKTPGLGIPALNAKDRASLFAYYAPDWLLDVVEPNDKIGRIGYTQDSELAQVDVADPVVYRRVSHTRFGDQVLLQLNYIVWFPARTKTGTFDILGGHLDGIMWRVTLDQQGQPLVYDTAHNCGCYHLFFPTHQVKFIAEDTGVYSEPPMSPAIAPNLDSTQRMVIRVAHLSHFVERIGNRVTAPNVKTIPYQFDDYERLETLATTTGSQSLFREDGLVEGTDRSERYMLWTMGVPSPGAMRQWGRHATAFLERRHFDDARLLEQIILLKD